MSDDHNECSYETNEESMDANGFDYSPYMGLYRSYLRDLRTLDEWIGEHRPMNDLNASMVTTRICMDNVQRSVESFGYGRALERYDCSNILDWVHIVGGFWSENGVDSIVKVMDGESEWKESRQDMIRSMDWYCERHDRFSGIESMFSDEIMPLKPDSLKEYDNRHNGPYTLPGEDDHIIMLSVYLYEVLVGIGTSSRPTDAGVRMLESSLTPVCDQLYSLLLDNSKKMRRVSKEADDYAYLLIRYEKNAADLRIRKILKDATYA